MSTPIRVLAAAAWFAVAGPVLGTGIATTLGMFGPIDAQQWEAALRDLIYSVLEFGVPAAVAGGVFFFLASLAFRRQSKASLIWLKGASGAAGMLVVFGIPFVEKLLAYGHLSRVWALISAFSFVTGAILGLAYPSRWLVPKARNAG